MEERPFPALLTLKEDGVVYAMSPLFDICSHGDTEEQAIENYLLTMFGEHWFRLKEFGHILHGLPPAPDDVKDVVDRYMRGETDASPAEKQSAYQLVA